MDKKEETPQQQQKQKSINFWDAYHQETTSNDDNGDENEYRKSSSSSIIKSLHKSRQNNIDEKDNDSGNQNKAIFVERNEIKNDGAKDKTEHTIKYENSKTMKNDEHGVVRDGEKEWILNSKSSIVLDAICSCLKPCLPFLLPGAENHDMELPIKVVGVDDTFTTKEASTTTKRALHIVEIGCGTSSLSRSLLQHLINRRRHHLRRQENELSQQSENQKTYAFYVTATDVSKVCIERNRRRDALFLESLSDYATSSNDFNDTYGLRYEVLDILDPEGVQLPPLPFLCKTTATCSSDNVVVHNDKTTRVGNSHDNEDKNINLVNMVLDKGCLDTFLYRCKTHDKSISQYPPLLTQLLINVYRMLRMGGTYVIVTPRRRITSVRDFAGFGGSVHRITIDPDRVGGRGDLCGQQKEECTSPFTTTSKNGCGNKQKYNHVYMHVCTKQPGYIPGVDEPYQNKYDTSLQDDASICNKCGISFLNFRNGEKMEGGRGVPFWTRRWKGHRVHCHGTQQKQ